MSRDVAYISKDIAEHSVRSVQSTAPLSTNLSKPAQSDCLQSNQTLQSKSSNIKTTGIQSFLQAGISCPRDNHTERRTKLTYAAVAKISIAEDKRNKKTIPAALTNQIFSEKPMACLESLYSGQVAGMLAAAPNQTIHIDDVTRALKHLNKSLIPHPKPASAAATSSRKAVQIPRTTVTIRRDQTINDGNKSSSALVTQLKSGQAGSTARHQPFHRQQSFLKTNNGPSIANSVQAYAAAVSKTLAQQKITDQDVTESPSGMSPPDLSKCTFHCADQISGNRAGLSTSKSSNLHRSTHRGAPCWSGSSQITSAQPIPTNVNPIKSSNLGKAAEIPNGRQCSTSRSSSLKG
ncbi:hypothetical protein PSTG_05667 [Puccinia striiformis f. sp. tritici PST-78]|uniref:Uncharacterized protein n=1 Tax=Puccinia striiformis f. sp. tritici PST-78 TaxID=1165861 RepID=A0A0L0VPW9_9BASI|nr:hypothetical protein PSTG_05667 [Puccinia striiformis f. sp. tritici PST-78]